MSLWMLSFQPDVAKLVRLAARERLLPPGDDLGYALHAVFSATFGDLAPKPFAFLPPGQGGGVAGRLLGYSAAPLNALLEHANAFADPGFMAPLQLGSAACKEMPNEYPVGRSFSFRVRVRPVIRASGKRMVDGSREKGRERDVYLAHVEMGGESAAETRASCYAAWLRARIAELGAELLSAEMSGFRFTRLKTRDRGSSSAGGRIVNGPDALFTGTLVVRDADVFAQGMARGIGRLRAFGFGMILLGPARS